MTQPPSLPYCGLTLVLDNPSRFDKTRLLTGYAGTIVSQSLQPYVLNQCDLLCVDDYRGSFRSGTTVVLLLGQKALRIVGQSANTVGEQRGSPFPLPNGGPIAVASFFPQDACDIQDYEARFNEADEDFGSDGDDDDKREEGDIAIKGHGKTRRKNYKFWLMRDIEKAVRITKRQGKLLDYEENFVIYPPTNTVLELLCSTKGRTVYADIETDVARNITCIGIAIDDGPVYVTPILRYSYSPAYGCLPQICRGLGLLLQRNEIVFHNSSFDLLVLAIKLRIPFTHDIYDTMLAQHRCFPEVEKSLGHCISLWTDLPFHKNEGIFNPHNEQQEQQLWRYNAKDVNGTRAVRKGIDTYAQNVKGLRESIIQANSMVRPYLTNTILGLAYNDDTREKMFIEVDRRMMQVLRHIEIAVGEQLNPSSPKQVSNYLYDGLGFAKPKKDLTSEKTLRKLLTKYESPVIQLILYFRSLREQAKKLTFEPWRRTI